VRRRYAHDLGPDATPLVVRSRLGVEQERMIAAIPGDIDQPDEQTVRSSGRDPPEAVGLDLVPSTLCRIAVREHQIHQFLVGDVAAPSVLE
jgi:hypothetical protein